MFQTFETPHEAVLVGAPRDSRGSRSAPGLPQRHGVTYSFPSQARTIHYRCSARQGSSSGVARKCGNLSRSRGINCRFPPRFAVHRQPGICFVHFSSSRAKETRARLFRKETPQTKTPRDVNDKVSSVLLFPTLLSLSFFENFGNPPPPKADDFGSKMYTLAQKSLVPFHKFLVHKLFNLTCSEMGKCACDQLHSVRNIH